jgi:hypothetical protein
MRPRYIDSIAHDAESEIRRQLAFEEDQDVGEQDAEAMRFHAKGIRARARYYEDKGEAMAPISIRWLRVLAKALEQGADARELFDA